MQSGQHYDEMNWWISQTLRNQGLSCHGENGRAHEITALKMHRYMREWLDLDRSIWCRLVRSISQLVLGSPNTALIVAVCNLELGKGERWD